jgi:hypothetical protein
MPIRSSALLRQWLLIVAIAAGLIGMHNLVVPAISTDDTRHHAAGSAPTRLDVDAVAIPSAAPPIDAAASLLRQDREFLVRAATSDTVGPGLVSASGCCPCMGAMIGHACQAVLGANPQLGTATVLLAATAIHDAPLTMTGGAASTLPARSPPTSDDRISLLGVWRR